MIGQWNHTFPDHAVGARSDFADILLRWWNRWLGGDRGQRTGPRVEVQDSDLRWRTERSWPPRRATQRSLYLSADDTLSEEPSERAAPTTLGPPGQGIAGADDPGASGGGEGPAGPGRQIAPSSP
jgi:predicted acyl esterase